MKNRSNLATNLTFELVLRAIFNMNHFFDKSASFQEVLSANFGFPARFYAGYRWCENFSEVNYTYLPFLFKGAFCLGCVKIPNYPLHVRTHRPNQCPKRTPGKTRQTWGHSTEACGHFAPDFIKIDLLEIHQI